MRSLDSDYTFNWAFDASLRTWVKSALTTKVLKVSTRHQKDWLLPCSAYTDLQEKALSSRRHVTMCLLFSRRVLYWILSQAAYSRSLLVCALRFSCSICHGCALEKCVNCLAFVPVVAHKCSVRGLHAVQIRSSLQVSQLSLDHTWHQDLHSVSSAIVSEQLYALQQQVPRLLTANSYCVTKLGSCSVIDSLD